jgi:tRNA A-37 threonylcarbamoyl transferase component Bud32
LTDTVEKTSDGAILYDTDILNQISEAAFTPGAWSSAVPVGGALRSGGRGNTLIVSDGDNDFVLRHYIRGGLPGKLIRDSYLWRGEAETRSFAEFYLLVKLVKRGLPVPRPVAARYCRRGLTYRADLLTMRIPGIRSLADRIVERPRDREFWRRIGRAIHRFHAEGVYHADLNAYNVQVDDDDTVFLLDFDRGELREAGVWRQKNIARLHRSLQKIRSLDPRAAFSKAEWNELLEGYFSESRSA